MSNLPENIAKECSLIEGIYYLGMGYVPYEYEIGEDVGDKIVSVKIRESWDYLYNENDTRDFINEDLSGCMKAKFGIEDESYNEKYIGIYTTSLEYFDRWTEDFISKISPCNESVVKYTEERRVERKLLEEFLPLKKSYDDKIAELTEDKDYELYLLLKSGKVKITGTPSSAIKEYEKIYPFLSFEFEKDGQEYFSVNANSYWRESIDKTNISFDSINFPESSLEFKIGNDRYKYLFVLISFEDLYNNIPQQLEYEVNAISTSIIEELFDLQKHKHNEFMQTYSIQSKEHLKHALEYIAKKEDGGQIQEWCYHISQGKI